MNPAAILGILNSILPQALAWYKELRDKNPDVPALSDEQWADVLILKGDAGSQKFAEYLAAHPGSTP